MCTTRYSFVTSPLHGGEWSSSSTIATTPGYNHGIPRTTDWWNSYLVWTICRREKPFSLTEIQTSDLLAHSIVCSATALSRLLLCCDKSFVSHSKRAEWFWNLSGLVFNEFFSKVRGTRLEAGHSPVHRAGGNNEWRDVSLHSYALMMCKRTLISTQGNYKDYQ
jgi:hypothetical protein